MDIRVSTGSLSNNTAAESASAITVIRQDQIALSTAKNLANLLEQYVPGMMLMTHSEGNKIGIRGLIAAENYKLLLLVNGKNITNMVYEGAILELDQWDMSDIEKVEVIRGPGSVTYGTGAIAGVINIITKSAKSNIPLASISFSNNQTYRSTGFNAQYRKQFSDVGVYSFLSYRATDGLKNPDYYEMSTTEPSDIRYLGQRTTDTIEAQDYLADGLGRPQVKGHVDLQYGDNLNAWFRYSQSGQTHNFNHKKYEIDASGNPTVKRNPRHVGLRGLVGSVNHTFKFSESSHLESSLTYDNQEYIRYNLRNPQYPENSVHNTYQYAFSQERMVATALYNLTPNETSHLVLGYEYNKIGIHAPWGKSDNEIWLYEGIDLISSATDTAYLADPNTTINGEPNTNTAEIIGNGLYFETHTQLIEYNQALTENTNITYAHRIDISNVSDVMFSPRLSFNSSISENNIAVVTVQRALRMMPLRAQYLVDKYTDSSQHESIDSIELSLTNTSIDNTSLNIRTYYNEISAVGFTGSKLEFLGSMDLMGVEFEGRYKKNNLELMINHSYLNLINMNMNEDLKDGSNRNNISFSDYYYVLSDRNGTVIPLELESYGSNLNNWSTNSTKFMLIQSFLDKKLFAHLNSQIFWDYEGAYDEMHMFQEAYNNFDTSTLSASDLILFNTLKSDFEAERALLEKEDAYKIDYAVNASLTYQWQKDENYQLNLSIFADNLLSSKKRYYVSTGSNYSIPNRLKFLDEPISIGLAVNIKFK